MPSLVERIASRNKPIRVSIIGIGSSGKGLAHQSHVTPGFEPVALADIRLERAIDCAEWLGLPYRVVETEAEVLAARSAGEVPVSQDGQLIARANVADVMIEASSDVVAGARHGLAALEADQHVVMMNYETAHAYGPLLARRADAAGRVFTCADGDQPTVIKRMVDDLRLWGLDLVMLGNMKGFHDMYSNPAKIAPEADKRGLDHQMCCAYTDGSKLGVEMAVLANSLGARVLKTGMHGPHMGSIRDIFDHFDFAGIWSPGDPPFVDYVLGAEPKGGVFAIAHTADPYQQYTLGWMPPDMGPGPFYLFYRPFHIAHMEVMNCVAEAVLDGDERLAPRLGFRCEVVAHAKRDLAPGDEIDGMGGYMTYGLIENLGTGDLPEGLPQLLSRGVRVKRAFRKDERIALSDCDYDETSETFRLYRAAQSA